MSSSYLVVYTVNSLECHIVRIQVLVEVYSKTLSVLSATLLLYKSESLVLHDFISCLFVVLKWLLAFCEL